MRHYPSEIVNPDGRRVIVFLHGFLGSRAEFKHIGRHFESVDKVVYVDLPGHGTHHIEEDAKWDDHLLELATFLYSCKGKKELHLVGYSMGGRVALNLALRWPALVDRLTLLSSSPGVVDPRQRHRRFAADRLLAKRMARSSVRSFLKFWYRQPLFRSFRAHPSFDACFEKRLRNDPLQLSRALVTMSAGAQPSLWAELPSLRMPTKLIYGVFDTRYAAIASQMARQNPKIQAVGLPNVGHVVHWEAQQVLTHAKIIENRSR